MTFKTQGIILRHQDWQDNHRLYTLLTRDRGKISAIARGVKKIKSKQNSKLKQFSVIEVMIANGRRLDTLATAETVADFPKVMDNLLVLGLASFCTELVDNLTREGEPDLKIYQLLKDVLNIFNEQGDQAPDKLKLVSWLFGLRLLDYLGYRVDWEKCVHCHKNLEEPLNIVSAHGGLACAKHQDEDAVGISRDGWRFLRASTGQALHQCLDTPTTPDFSREIISYIRPLVFSHLNRELKSERFLAGL